MLNNLVWLQRNFFFDGGLILIKLQMIGLLSFFSISIWAQLDIDSSIYFQIERLKRDTNQNLVPNYSFENYSDCPEGCSVIPKSYFVDSWIMATIGTPDYFNQCSNESGVPDNWVGKLYAKTGAGYVGLIPGAYINSNFNPEEKREYIEAKLKEKLKKGEYYYLGFSTSLAARAPYALNGVGIYLSDTLVNINNSIYHLPFKPQLVNKNNEIINEKFKWIDVGGIIKANGSENYIIIGNFQSDEDTRVVDSKTQGSLNCSYYLIDDVYVIPLGETKHLSGIKYKTDNSTRGLAFVIHFDFADVSIKHIYTAVLDSIIRLKKLNPSVQLDISGHTDSIGSNLFNQRLSEMRAKVVVEYFTNHAIISKSLKWKGYGKNSPVAGNNTERGRALNRRVEIKIE